MVATAAVVAEPVPVTPDVAKVSPLTKPLTVVLSVGLACPYRRDALLAVTVSCALLMVKLPSRNRLNA